MLRLPLNHISKRGPSWQVRLVFSGLHEYQFRDILIYDFTIHPWLVILLFRFLSKCLNNPWHSYVKMQSSSKGRMDGVFSNMFDCKYMRAIYSYEEIFHVVSGVIDSLFALINFSVSSLRVIVVYLYTLWPCVRFNPKARPFIVSI